MRALLLIVIALTLAACTSREAEVDFNAEVRPILNENCLGCHGGVKQAAEFSLLFRSDAMEPTESGALAIVPGDVDASELIRRLHLSDPEERMPLDAERLSKREIDILTRWIEQGAEWEEHWAYVKPEWPDVPPVSDTTWSRNEIDRFVLARLDEEGLNPSPEVDPARLIRRVSLDLTGLPPTLEDVEAFVADPSDEAYEQVVDRLLDSPQFGERWASMWLDLARYADSRGFEKDAYRNIWQYRDWVIQAFNDDKPFDQFTIEQLAGDLLPNPTADQLLATAFHRNTMNNGEGGTDDEEYRVMSVLDRVNTTWTVWQGTTMECVQCHSHPYDPIRHEAYFKSYAFFNNSQDADLRSEVPYYESFEPATADTIRRIAAWVDQHDPDVELPDSDHLADQIKRALFPKLIAGDADDFEHVTVYPDRVVSNWTNNVNAVQDRSFMFKFESIDLTDVTHITYTYATPGNDAALELRLDSLNGRQMHYVRLPKTGRIRGPEGGSGDSFIPYGAAIEPVEGQHDLYFILHNTTDKIPDGIATIRELEFHKAGRNLEYAEDLKARQDSLIELRKAAIQTPIMKARTDGNWRPTHVFERGNWLVHGEKVEPDVPEVWPDLPEEAPRDRLGLAQWLVHPDNPLTARVTVNRFWEQIFGRGLVLTVEDFGTQGEKPTHPELLDWLALDFMHEQDWSMKALLKQIVTTSTYRQQSNVDPEILERDPANRLLARGPRLRLPAEQVRDQALAVSGLLSDKMYGKSVMPYQPEGVWQNVYSSQEWEISEGEDRYRRSVYTYWRRTSPHPAMMAFDKPSREFCMPRRVNTNTPLQALVTLNDTTYVEAAAMLAERVLDEGVEDKAERVEQIYRMALFRSPSPAKKEILCQLYDDGLAHAHQTLGLKDETEAAHTALTIVANAVLNLDEFVVKD